MGMVRKVRDATNQMVLRRAKKAKVKAKKVEAGRRRNFLGLKANKESVSLLMTASRMFRVARKFRTLGVVVSLESAKWMGIHLFKTTSATPSRTASANPTLRIASAVIVNV